MKIAALIVGLLASIVVLGIGALWTENYDHLKDLDQMEQTMRDLSKEAGAAGQASAKELLDAAAGARRKARASYPMVVLGLLGFVASFLVFKLPRVTGGVLALVGLVPAVLAPLSLAVGWLALLASLFAFLVKPKPAVAKAA